MSVTKNKGVGTIFLVFLLLLGVAGASAFFIHKVLSGEDMLPNATTMSGDPVDSEQATAAGDPSGISGQAQPFVPMASSAPVPPGQLVVPPANIPSPPQPLSGEDTQEFQAIDQIPTTVDIAPPSLTEDGQDSSSAEFSEKPGPPLLLVPGAMPDPSPSVREDSVVRPAFVDDIATFLVHNYWPKNTHPSARRSGITTASLQWANLRYGAELRGLEGGIDPRSVRRAILGYVLNPAIVERIYNLYADEFVAALKQRANERSVDGGKAKRPLTDFEKKEMFGIYSGYASNVASALENYASDSAMPGRVRTFADAEQAVQDANRVYLESMLTHEEAAASDDRARITAARLRMDKEAATYQKRVRERETAKNALVSAMSKGKTRRDADTLVYAAFWAYRRGEDSSQSLRACAKALGEMGVKLAAVGKQI